MRFLSALVAGLFLVGTLCADERPTNIVLIVADDLGWSDLGCYGNKVNKTPNLDALIGVRFTQAYALAPLAAPTQAAMLTGQHPARLHFTDSVPASADSNENRLGSAMIGKDLKASLLSESLLKKGYATGLIGKWNLGGRPRGFSTIVAGDITAKSYFSPFQSASGKALLGLENAEHGEYLTDRLTREAVNFLEQNSQKPFFLMLSHFAPHTPLESKAELLAKYQATFKPGQGNPHYAAMLESLDTSVGQVLHKLDALKIADRTLVIFTSHNGGLCTTDGPNTPSTSNAPLREGKGFLYEGGIRVPLLIRWPGMTKSQNCTAPVSALDLYETISRSAGLPGEKSDGRALEPILDQKPIGSQPLYWHFPHYSVETGRPSGAIRDGDFKLMEFFENGRLELFDLKADPGENRNLSEEKPRIVTELAGKLKQWRGDVKVKLPDANPNYRPNQPQKDGSIVMPCRSAIVHGVMLRYEPLPHKNTLGYWVRAEDWAEFDFTATKPGKFTVEMLQGCGKGFGGSVVEVAVGEQKLEFVVEDTGHFQNFKARDIGTIQLEKAGQYKILVKPKKKASVAVMDLREIKLKPVER